MMVDTEVRRRLHDPKYAASIVTFPENNVADESCRVIKISFRTETAEPESLEMDTSKKEANK